MRGSSPDPEAERTADYRIVFEAFLRRVLPDPAPRRLRDYRWRREMQGRKRSSPEQGIRVDKDPPQESQLQQAAEPGWLTRRARART